MGNLDPARVGGGMLISTGKHEESSTPPPLQYKNV